MICRFYSGYTLDKVEDLTVQEFEVLMDNIEKINKIENPDPENKKGNSDVSYQGLKSLTVKK